MADNELDKIETIENEAVRNPWRHPATVCVMLALGIQALIGLVALRGSDNLIANFAVLGLTGVLALVGCFLSIASKDGKVIFICTCLLSCMAVAISAVSAAVSVSIM